MHVLLAKGVTPRLYQMDKDSMPVFSFGACKVTQPTVSACGQRDWDRN
jgi:hypothetical protein